MEVEITHHLPDELLRAASTSDGFRMVSTHHLREADNGRTRLARVLE